MKSQSEVGEEVWHLLCLLGTSYESRYAERDQGDMGILVIDVIWSSFMALVASKSIGP